MKGCDLLQPFFFLHTYSMQSVNIITLGCSKNTVDSEHLARQLQALNYKLYFDSETFADIVIINTCGFIHDAKQESINTILSAVQAKKCGKIKKLYVMGCLSERYADDLRAEIPEVDSYFGARGYDDILHGGIISTILDSAMVNLFYLKDGLELKTVRLNLRFIRPIPATKEITIYAAGDINRRHFYKAKAKIMIDNIVFARAEGYFK